MTGLGPLRMVDERIAMTEFWASPSGKDTEDIIGPWNSAAHEGHTWRHGDLYWVSREMTDLWQAAAPSLPAQKLLPTDPPYPRGVIVVERPLVGLESSETLPDDTRVLIDAVLWAPIVLTDSGRNSLRISFYSRPTAEDIHSVRDGPYPLPPYIKIGGSDWPLGATTEDDFITSDPSGVTDRMRASIIEDRKLIATFWTLSQQRLAVSRPVGLPRSTTRRCQRAGIEPSPVTVVTLRRSHSEIRDGVPEHRNWSHRWLVGGHWRNQYLPRTGAHRQQWIAPYVKGPEDKPLVIKDRVNAWVR